MSSGLGRYYFGRALPAIAFLVVVLLSYLTWFTFTKLSDEPRAESSARPSTLQNENSGDARNSVKKERIEDNINRKIRAFSRLYFSLSPSLTPDEAKERVTPYVTANFLNSAQFGFGSSDADRAMIEEEASLKVRAITELVGYPQGATTIEGSVQLSITKIDRNGKILVKPRVITQQLTLVKQGKTWLIDNAPLT